MSYGTVQAEKMTTESGYSLGAGNSSSFKNRIINPGMVIDQRNNGASVTPIDGQYGIDRWKAFLSASSKFSFQQNAGSVTPPVGFTNYLGCTSLSAYTLGTNDYFIVQQSIEGSNFSDMAWGTANAKSVTLSFWVRSSLTGQFGGAIVNSSLNRSYAYSYTINAANTWEYKTVVISGDTTGTWLTTTGVGVQVRFSLGAGTNYQKTAGSWVASDGISSTGSTNVVSTNGATWYVTGVQFEVGTVATSFDYRSYGTELALCQRYFFRTETNQVLFMIPNQFDNPPYRMQPTVSFPVVMRAAPTITGTGDANAFDNAGTAFAVSSYSSSFSATNACGVTATRSGSNWPSGNIPITLYVSIRASSEL